MMPPDGRRPANPVVDARRNLLALASRIQSGGYTESPMTYQFGAFEFDDRSLELRKNGRLVAIEPQPARALALLLARANDVVTRDELKGAVWGAETHVDFDRGLAYCLSQVRSALGDKGDNPRFVQTLPRKGYCFVAPVRTPGEPVAAPPVSNAASANTSPVRARRSTWLVAAALLFLLAVGVAWFTLGRTTDASRQVIAVSIFDNETGNAEHDRLVSGLSDLVVSRLTEMAPTRLAVIGNAEALRRPRNIRNLKAVAAGVRADYVVLGQLQRSETGLRFITHLIRLRDETHLKANRLQMPNGDVSGLEAAVVAEFERAVRAHVLTP
jgi:DNA-binding winged helix-turn-helix (wHTH) protein/TolB-like protein